MLIRILVLVALFSYVFGCSVTPDQLTPPQEKSEAPPQMAPKIVEQRMVRLAVFDDTTKQRIPLKGEIWFRDFGPVWLQQRCDRLTNGSLSCGPIDLGMRDVEQPLELYVYADGRHLNAEGREADEVKVTFKMTEAMCKLGCDRDVVTVAIGDETVEVSGAPILAQHGMIRQTFQRK